MHLATSFIFVARCEVWVI